MGEVAVADADAVGRSCWNLAIWNRERASAIGLSIPGMCLNDTENSKIAAWKNRGRIKDIILGQEDVPEFQMWVMARLSVKKTILFPDHLWPHVRTCLLYTSPSPRDS